MRFLHFLPRGHSMLKKVRIGFTILKSSFKSVFFNHQHYFGLCLLLTSIQFLHLKFTGLIHQRLTVGVVITELLAGENFFEILWHDAHFTISAKNFFTFLEFVILLYIEIVLMFFILCAAAHHTLKQHNYSLLKSIKSSLTHWRAICVWALFELCVQATTSLFGTVGALLYFMWNILTIFDVQILSFDRGGAHYVLKKSWTLFKQAFSEIVALDVIIEGVLIIVGLMIYAASQQYIPGTDVVGSGKYSNLVIFLMLYMISTVMIFEVILFTGLYKTIKK